MSIWFSRLAEENVELVNAINSEYLMQFFAYAHLPVHLQAASKPFRELAETICCLPVNAERTTALRKLLEAKDCAVRAVLFKS